jgi:hypothetical protein
MREFPAQARIGTSATGIRFRIADQLARVHFVLLISAMLLMEQIVTFT